MTTLDRVTLTPHQANACDRVVELFRARDTVTMGGLAGVGKTTVTRFLVERLADLWGGPVAVCAFTGKACHVLRRKGLPQARTLHSLLYVPVIKKHFDRLGRLIREEVVGWKLQTALREFAEEDGPGERYAGVVVDESSMIPSALHQDLMSFGLPVLFVGDHGQLEPVGGNPRLMASPDVVLEEILRQEEGSGIIQFAHGLRHGWSPSEFLDRALPDVDVIRADDLTEEILHDADRVICGWNRTRACLNARIRELRGFSGDLCVGEELIRLRNCRELGMFNGMILTVDKVRRAQDVDSPAIVDLVTEDGERRDRVEVDCSKFCKVGEDAGDFDYAPALTCHKSQGAEWDNVVVIEEVARSWSAPCWRYTGATRAAKKLTWVVP